MAATRAVRLRLVETASDRDHASQGDRMKIAIATQDLKEVNAHFAGARLLAIYEVSAEGSQFLEAVGFDQVSQEDGAGAGSDDDAHEDLAQVQHRKGNRQHVNELQRVGGAESN